jgi:epoxyqueuosine reductase
LLDDASNLVRAMAVWALRRLLPKEDFSALARVRADLEPDRAVAAEWRT